MGAGDAVPNILLPDDNHPEEAAAFRAKWRWEAHELVILRGTYTGIEQEAVDNASSGIKGKGKSRRVDMRLGTARNKLLETMILDWTLTRAGRKMEVVPGNIIRLPANYRKPILEVCDQVAEIMDEEEEENFLPSSNGHSPESSNEEKSSLTPS